jgi:uncharacterized protein YbjQ (UPF0145 family)
MKIATMETISGHANEKSLGIVRGSTLWARRVLRIPGGGPQRFESADLNGNDQSMTVAQQKAETAMVAKARAIGADAIVGVLLEVIEMANGVFCMNATGTAVRTLSGSPATKTPPFFEMPNFDWSASYMPHALAHEASNLRH